MDRKQVVNGKDILSRAREIFDLEIEAAQAVRDRLDEHFVEAVKAILNCDGKVILVGAGKSGIIAHKIAATLRSVGIVSLFLHPGDAAHGDLGMVSDGDVVILISKSGETGEVYDLVPALRSHGATLIAMVGETASRLANSADIWVDIGVEREACPIGLAPTSSTTVTMLTGDAIAAVLMQLLNVTPDDFARNHPGGSLGKRLLLAVRDLMHSGDDNPVTTCGIPMSEILVEMTQTRLGGINVVDESGHLLGLVTDGDIRRGIQKHGREFMDVSVESVMTPDPIHVHEKDKAIDALLMMEHRPNQIMVLPVVNEDEKCVGLLRLHDLIRAGLRSNGGANGTKS